jgi:hypothetical protein
MDRADLRLITVHGQIKEKLIMLKYIFLFLVSFSTVGLGGCSMLTEVPALFNRSDDPSSSQSGMMSMVGSTLRMVPAPLRVAGINTALGVSGTGFRANLLENEEDTVQITGKVKGLPVDIFFNLSGQTTSEFFSLRLMDIDIPLSKAGVTPALKSTIARQLQKKGFDEQTANSILTGLQQVISVIRKYLQK